MRKMDPEEQRKLFREIDHYLIKQAAIIVGIIFGAFVVAKMLKNFF